VAKLWRHRRALEELLDPAQALPGLPLFQPSRYLALPAPEHHACGQVGPAPFCPPDPAPALAERHRPEEGPLPSLPVPSRPFPSLPSLPFPFLPGTWSPPFQVSPAPGALAPPAPGALAPPAPGILRLSPAGLLPWVPRFSFLHLWYAVCECWGAECESACECGVVGMGAGRKASTGAGGRRTCRCVGGRWSPRGAAPPTACALCAWSATATSRPTVRHQLRETRPAPSPFGYTPALGTRGALRMLRTLCCLHVPCAGSPWYAASVSGAACLLVALRGSWVGQGATTSCALCAPSTSALWEAPFTTRSPPPQQGQQAPPLPLHQQPPQRQHRTKHQRHHQQSYLQQPRGCPQ